MFSYSTEHNLQKILVINAIEADPAIQNYYNSIKSRRNNNGLLSPCTRINVRSAIYAFTLYADLPQNGQAFTDLVKYKKENPKSSEIETVLRAYANEPPLKTHTITGSIILGIFRANFAPLDLKLYNHFAPAEENCSEGQFLEIYSHLDQESKDMLQWNQYVPERAKAAFKVPFEDIDLTRSDYAIVRIQKERSKTRVKHPCFVPIDFAKKVIAQAQATGRDSPFPNHESLWRNISEFAKREYNIDE